MHQFFSFVMSSCSPIGHPAYLCYPTDRRYSAHGISPGFTRVSRPLSVPQAIQRTLQAHMPDTLVEWAGAESRHSGWTGLEARVFSPC